MKGIRKATLIVLLLTLILPCLYIKANTIHYKVASQNHDPILFIHGWLKTSQDWTYFKEWFQADGWPESILYVVDFYTNPQTTNHSSECSVHQNILNARDIKFAVNNILWETGAEKVDLVGHSMGGISSRYYIKFLDGIDKVDDYVSLGCDHHGEGPKGQCYPYPNSLILSLNEGDETPGGILNDTLGDRYDSFWGITYNGTHIPGNISYTSIYSPADSHASYLSCPLDGANNTELPAITHSQFYQDKSVYYLVRAAVGDGISLPTPTATPTITQPPTTTQPTTTEITTGLRILPFLAIIIFTTWFKRKR